ncbi:carbohydrate ABC transporter permease [Clostridium grantii]|uniref:Carbohydrate ABC transporter membrane protein 2, CUT1 family (TC 3.A.1.1.-) n=1 Tax=Clostridium grantii DSM 8605 TaxID=1121316 RepID=A0A1M5WK71_9CLOT|nr:carbohydrate ABC transporter permease [Clostridium grantii]SHH87946.1 carbohydrate ABC transporter membrane protein 2, CUT1 family (TC 3.A.1.1.-) [Clostridium grantii DSM 8605]
MKKIKNSKEDMIFDIIKYVVLTIALLLVMYPLWFVIIASISSPDAINTGQVWFKPIGFTLEGYKRILQDSTIWIGYRNTILYTVVGTAINLFLTITLAYPLARKDFKFGKFIMIFLLITMYFNGGLIPRYLIVKQLNLIDNWWVMVIVNAVSVFNVIIAVSFLRGNIPEELYEAATLDGCSHITFLWRIVLPLSKPIVAVLLLYYGVANWNDFFTGLIYLRNEKLYPLQLILRSILIQNQMESNMVNDVNALKEQNIGELIKYGVIIVSSLPVLMVYPFLQKYFVQGVMIGSVKG